MCTGPQRSTWFCRHEAACVPKVDQQITNAELFYLTREASHTQVLRSVSQARRSIDEWMRATIVNKEYRSWVPCWAVRETEKGDALAAPSPDSGDHLC